ncbi:MAG: hypothetical protein GTO12_17965 [Proteobacteria bacterium]|nr:hypothetical protein [Pseudomonadota bacterium]
MLITGELVQGIIQQRSNITRNSERYVGGKGLAAFYLYNEIKTGIGLLAPENKLVFFIGPLTGICSIYSRYVIAPKWRWRFRINI